MIEKKNHRYVLKYYDIYYFFNALYYIAISVFIIGHRQK